jgi:hypothetical protein
MVCNLQAIRKLHKKIANEREDNGMLGDENSHPFFHKFQAWEGLKHCG